MGKLVIKKSVANQITSKLKTHKNDDITPEFAENLQKSDLFSENKQVSVKLQSNKNIGVTPDDCYYDLDNPTEKFYYDLKMKFAQSDKADDIEKSHKYIRRWKMNNGEWRYEYPKGVDKKIHSFRDVTTALTNKTTEIKDIQPLTTEKQIDAELERLTKLSEEGKLTCPALGNANIYIEDMTTEHAEKTNGVFRTKEAKIHKLQYLSFVEDVLKNGILFMKSRKYNHAWSLDKISERERTTYGIINKVTYFDKKKNKNITCGMEIVVAWDNERKRFVFSFIDRQIKKSLLFNKDFQTTTFEAGQVGACKTEAFSTTDSIIPHLINLSSRNVNKSLTYSGYKLQGRTRLYGMDISIENKKGSYRCGVDSDGHKWEILMHYDYGYIRGTVGVDKDHLDCVSPETKILMADYTEKSAADIKEGDELIGIKLETQQHKQRKQIKTKVIHVKKGMDDMLDITLENGVKLRTTKGHLHYYFQGKTRDKYWKRADELKIGDKLVMIYNHHNFEETEDYKKGYLFGAYIGDGCYNFDESKQVYCDIRKGVAFIDVIHRVKQYWNDLGLETSKIRIDKPRQTNSLLADGRKVISKMDLAILSIRGINKIRYIKSILVKNPKSFEWCRGYIAGLFDTDGCLNCRHEFLITQTKNQDEFMKFTIECINKLGYQAVKRYNEIKLHTDYMADNITMEFTQIIKPALEKKRNFLGQTYRYEPLEIVDIKPYTGEFVAIQTDEQTYIANGLVTHNCYVGPDKNTKKVYVIHQNNPITHKYDEDKCMLCFESADAAKKAYMKQYDRPGFFGSMETLTVEQFKTFVFSKQGSRIHKSFDIEITDITENNKQRKVEQVEKALNAIYNNKPFVIEHISKNLDFSRKYNDILMRITDFDKNKIEKAVHSLAFTLDTKVKASKGEAFVYASQEDLTNQIVNEITEKTKKIYNFVISFFDLPEITIVRKANLIHKGKIIYNPETGEPVKKAEWDKFVEELEKMLNKNYMGYGEKIVLKGETLGLILDRLAKTNSFEAIQKKKLSDIVYKRKHFDWISDDIKNLKTIIGEPISRERAARIEVAMQSVGQRISRVKDSLKNEIQQVIIDGIKNKESKRVVSQNLFDKCVGLNRDFQKIADSEIQNTVNNAYIKEEVFNSDENEKIYFKRFEVIDDNTCSKCKKIKGKLALYSKVPLDDEHIKDEYADYAIWEGKVDGDLPMGILHPYCRGSWVRYYPEVD